MHKVELDLQQNTEFYLGISEQRSDPGKYECPMQGCFHSTLSKKSLGIHLHYKHKIKSPRYEENKRMRENKMSGSSRGKRRQEHLLTWNEDEIASVVNHMAELRCVDITGDINDIFKEAQISLSEEKRWRHRNIPAKIINMVQAVIDAKLTENLLGMPIIIEKFEPVDVPSVVAHAPSDMIFAEFAKRLSPAIDKIKTLFVNAMPNQTALEPTVIPTVRVEAPKSEIKRIAIIGLLSDQASEVRKKLGNVGVSLHFQEKAMKQKDLVRADAAIVTRFTRHCTWDNVRAKYGSDNVAFVNGGITEVVNKILTFNQGLSIR
jgi:hypothetical protein